MAYAHQVSGALVHIYFQRRGEKHICLGSKVWHVLYSSSHFLFGNIRSRVAINPCCFLDNWRRWQGIFLLLTEPCKWTEWMPIVTKFAKLVAWIGSLGPCKTTGRAMTTSASVCTLRHIWVFLVLDYYNGDLRCFLQIQEQLRLLNFHFKLLSAVTTHSHWVHLLQCLGCERDRSIRVGVRALRQSICWH